MFWSALEYTSLAYFVAIRNILQTFGMLHGHLVYFVAILVYFWFVASRKNLATLETQIVSLEPFVCFSRN
jgi:hypothetical protein